MSSHLQTSDCYANVQLPGAPPQRATRRSSEFWAVFLLTSAMFAAAAVPVLKIDRAWALAVEYLCWGFAARRIALQAKKRRSARIGALPEVAIALFLTSLVISHLLVWQAEIRTDIVTVFAQVAALMFLSVPFFAMASMSKSDNAGRAIVWTCHVVLILCSISIVGEFLGVAHYEGGSYGRYFGFLGDQAAWAVTLPIIVYFSTARFFLALLATVTLALTASRAPSICLAVAILLLVLVVRRHRVRQMLTLAPLLVFVGLSGSLFRELFARLGETQFTSNDRITTARAGLRLFHQSAIFGMGYNAQQYFYPGTERRHFLGEWSVQTSTVVQILEEGGLLVFAPYVFFVAACTAGGVILFKYVNDSDDSRSVAGGVAWLLAMLWVNQSAAWLLVGSYVAPLVFAMAGLVSGYWARMRLPVDGTCFAARAR